MKIYTTSTNIVFPLVTKRDTFILLNTNSKLKYTHLCIKTTLTVDESIEILCNYILEHELKEDCDIKINKNGLLLNKTNIKQNSMTKIQSKILELGRDDKQIEKILNTIN